MEAADGDAHTDHKDHDDPAFDIERKKEQKNCPFSFFDVKSWIVMIFMICMGITIRSFHLLPESFISVFYTGLSIALILTGVLFIRYWWLRRKTNPV